MLIVSATPLQAQTGAMRWRFTMKVEGLLNDLRPREICVNPNLTRVDLYCILLVL